MFKARDIALGLLFVDTIESNAKVLFTVGLVIDCSLSPSWNAQWASAKHNVLRAWQVYRQLQQEIYRKRYSCVKKVHLRLLITRTRWSLSG